MRRFLLTLLLLCGHAFATITYVGGAVNSISGGSAGAQTLTVTYSPTSGNVVLVFLYSDFGQGWTGTATFTDSGSNSLTVDYSDTMNANCNNTTAFTCIYFARETVGAGITSFVAHYTVATGKSDSAMMRVFEFSGVNTYDAATATCHDNGYDGTSGGTAAFTSNASGTLSNVNDLLLGMSLDFRQSTQTWTMTSPFAAVASQDNISNVGAGRYADDIAPGSTTGIAYQGTFTQSGNSQIYACVLAYKPSGGATAHTMPAVVY
jgi:hypothetical protein